MALLKRPKRDPRPIVLDKLQRQHWLDSEQMANLCGLPQATCARTLTALWREGAAQRQPGRGSRYQYRRAR